MGRSAFSVALVLVVTGCEVVFPLETSLPARGCFVDNFDGPGLDPFWVVVDPASPHEVADNADDLVINLAPSVESYNGVRSASPQRVDLARVRVYVGETAASDGFVETTMQLKLDAGDYAMISVGGGSIGFDGVVEGERSRVIEPYAPTLYRYWSMRHEPGAFVFETMDDAAVDWVERHRVMVDGPLSATLLLYGGTFQGGRPDPGSIRFDDYALEQPSCP